MLTAKRATQSGMAILCLLGVLIGLSGGAASASKEPIVIGLVTDETGGTSSSYMNDQYGAEARIDAQNAAGGIDGRKIELVTEDSQSTAAGNLTASQTLVQDKGVFGIINLATATFGAASYLQKQGIPVVGAEVDGPEWGQEPNTNMVNVYASGALLTPYDGKLYNYNNEEVAFKDSGTTKLAQVVANVPSAINAANSTFASAKPLGIGKCLDSVTPLGDVNFTTFALEMKRQGCNGVAVLSTLSTCIAVASALKQAAINVPDYCATGYDQSILTQPSALAAMQGTFSTAFINVLGKQVNAPTKLFVSRLKKYTSWPGGIPSLNIDFAYESADLFIQGLEQAGANATRAKFIATVRKISSYTTDGLIPAPVDNFTHFGTVAALPKKFCEIFYEVKGKSYIPYLKGKSICGSLLVASG
jgi:branched-chain amino acid transport system substrate-binding protein